jgi:hypothetical protein
MLTPDRPEPFSLGRADLHLHTSWSDGMATVRQVLEHAERHTDLDVIAITDHDQVRGALEAVEWCAGRPGGRLQAIVGTEISSAWGRHVLALFFAEPFPREPFPRFRSLADTVAAVHDAGGIVVLPHPCSRLVPSVGERTFRAMMGGRPRSVVQALQGVEVCSGVIGGRAAEAKLRRVNAIWGLATVGSSDAHHLAQIGSACTRFPGRTPADLLRAIYDRRTSAEWGSEPRVSLLEHVRQNWRSLVVKPARELRGLVTHTP